MVEHNFDSELAQDPAESEGDGVDLDQVKEIGGFVVRSARRRPVLAATTFVAVAALGLGAAAVIPRTYSSQVRILTQRTAELRVLSSPNSELQRVDDPTKNAANMILRRDNLTALVRQANLAARFQESRPPILRLKDRLTTWLNGPPSDEDKLQVVVSTLERKLEIYTDGDTLVMSVDWPSPQMAYELVTLVQKNFLEARYDSDLAVITDSLAVLKEHAKSETARLDDALQDYAKIIESTEGIPVTRSPGPRVFAGVPSTSPSSPAAVPDPAATLALEETRMRIRALEQERERLLDSLKQQLAQAQLSLTPLHPTVVALQQRLDAMSEPSQELRELKSRERALLSQTEAQGSTADPGLKSHAYRITPGMDPIPTPPPSAEHRSENGQMRLARSKLEAAIQGYETAMARIDAANIELDITRTAYKYRYTVLSPAELPSRPTKPLAQMVAAGSLIAAAVLAFIVAAVADLFTGRIIESWQIKRRLKLEVVGELDGAA